MGDSDRSWNYSRSSYSNNGHGHGSNPRTNYDFSSGVNSYSRSNAGDEIDYKCNYTRSRSNNTNRDDSNRSRYSDWNRNQNNRERDSHRGSYNHRQNFGRGTDDANNRWKQSRDTDLRSNQVARNYQTAPSNCDRSRSDATVSSHWPRGNRSRSPSAYINPSPPRRLSNTSQYVERPSSPPRGTHARFRNDSQSQEPISVSPHYSIRNKPEIGPSRIERRSSDEIFRSRHPHQGVEIEKLTSRLKEYVPWLTARKASIFEFRRDKELKEEVDDIDWCLDVIQDIKSDENVGMQTLKRAQDMVMALISKGPITAPKTTIVTTEIKSEGVSREEIYSARSPSPPSNLDGAQFARRNENVDSHPRVIPTDREIYPNLPSAFPPSRFQSQFYAQRNDAPVPVVRTRQPFATDVRVCQPHSSVQQTADPKLSNATQFPAKTPVVTPSSNTLQTRDPRLLRLNADSRIYDYGHGQPTRARLDEDLFERRKPTANYVNDEDISKKQTEEAEARAKKAELDRRSKQWEESSDEDEAVHSRWNSRLDEDMRFHPSQSVGGSGFPASKPSRSTTNYPENIQKSESPNFCEKKSFGFFEEKSTSSTSVQNRPVTEPPVVTNPIPNPVGTLPQQSYPPLVPPINLMNFNPFLNTIDPTQIMRQAQLFMGFPPVAGQRTGLLPIPTAKMPNDNSTVRFPTKIGNYGVPPAPMDIKSQEEVEKTEQEIMMSRIKARAAECFSNRTPNSKSQPPVDYTAPTDSVSMYNHAGTSRVSQEPQLNQPYNTSVRQTTQILDPRLKPRQPRECKDPFRLPNSRTEQTQPSIPAQSIPTPEVLEPAVVAPEPTIPETTVPEPIVPEPVLDVPVPEVTDRYTELSDSDNDLKIDLSPPPVADVDDNGADEKTTPEIPCESSTLTSVQSDNSVASNSTQNVVTENDSSSSPEKGSIKSSISSVSDELVQSLLFKSLSAEEAEVLRSSEDYLASTLARLKEELSAKVKERTRQMSGESGNVSSTTLPVATNAESKDEDEPVEEDSRSRRVTRSSKKLPIKRRSSLERLHDALREMNFDSMMPLGRRRNAKLPTETNVAAEGTVQDEGSLQAPKIPTPKLSPVVMLKNCGQPHLRTGSESPSHRATAESESAETEKPAKSPVKRKSLRRKAKDLPPEPCETLMSKASIPANESDDATAPKKSRNDNSEVQSDSKLTTDISRTYTGEATLKSNASDPLISNITNVNAEVNDAPPMEFLTPEDSLTELMDLGKDLQTNPADFGLQEDEDMLFKPEDFAITLSDDDIPNLKTDDDPGISAEDFVINAAGLVAINNLDMSASSICSKDTTTTESVQLDGGRTELSRRRVKSKGYKGVSEVYWCSSCEFSGTTSKMVAHYVNEHPGTLIPQASIMEKAFQSLQERNKSDSPQLMEVQFNKPEPIRCIYCNIILSSIAKYSQHLTGHTGEFLYKCSICNIKFAKKQMAVFHCRSHRKDKTVQNPLVETKLFVEEEGDEFYGYVCRECNYFQMSSESIREHLDLTKHCETDVVCIKFKAGATKRTQAPRQAKSRTTRSSTEMESVVVDVKEDATTPSQPPPPPLPSPVTVCSSETIALPDSPKVQIAEAPRYKRSKRRHTSYLLQCCEAAEKLYASKNSAELLTPDKLVESDEEIVRGSEAVIQGLLNTVCSREEIDEEIRQLLSVIETSEAAFSTKPVVNMDGSFSIRDVREESLWLSYAEAENYMYDELEDEVEPNDYFMEEVIQVESDSDNEGSLHVKEKHGGTPGSNLDLNQLAVATVGTSLRGQSASTPQPGSSKMTNPLSSSPMSRAAFSNPPSSWWYCNLASEYCDTELVANLEGKDLYRCGNRGCIFASMELGTLKSHFMLCEPSRTNREFPCIHCDKRYKTWNSFAEHLALHGKSSSWCAICKFKGITAAEMKKHYKFEHQYRPVFKERKSRMPSSCVGLWYPKEILENSVDIKLIEKNPLAYVPRIQFYPEEIDDIPRSSTMLSEIHCALCSYSNKIRSNMIRHLKMHKWAEEEGSEIVVPTQATVNSVPWLERKELMFDKMTNWAGSTHTVKSRVPATIKEKVPQYVEPQYRYVCSVPSCAHLTVDDVMLRAHMRALHSEYDSYRCPHCYQFEPTRSDANNTVAIDKLGIHLKLHGSKLIKCGHCDFLCMRNKVMEKHQVDKHVGLGLRPCYYVIRGEDEADASKLKGGIGTDEAGKGSGQWRCLPCKYSLPDWHTAKEHILKTHNVKSQFLCDSCLFGTDSIYQLAKHASGKKCFKRDGEVPQFLVFFSRTELADENYRLPIWRRVSSRDHLRGIYYLHENEVNVVPEPVPAVPKVSSPVKPLLPPPPPPTKLKGNTRRKQNLPSSSKRKGPSTYSCCQCGTYKTKSAENMRTHLRQHLDYHRYTCKICGNRSWTMNSFKLHVEVDHAEPFVHGKFVQTEPKNAAIETKLEAWMLLSLQDPLAPDDDEITFLPTNSKVPNSPSKTVFKDGIVILD